MFVQRDAVGALTSSQGVGLLWWPHAPWEAWWLPSSPGSRVIMEHGHELQEHW